MNYIILGSGGLKYTLIGIFILSLLYLFYHFYVKENYSTIPSKKFPYNVVIAGCARNIEQYIQNSIQIIDRIGSQFNLYSVIIYENDSNDKTREILNQNKQDNYYYIFRDNVDIPQRTGRLSNCRNEILDKIKEIENNQNIKYDYLIKLDLDDVISSGKIVDTIGTCFKYEPNSWDILSGNQSDFYYDIWALRKDGLIEDDCWKMYHQDIDKGLSHDEAFNKNIGQFQKKIPLQGLIPTQSSFGGVAVYKLSSVDSCKYNGINSDQTEICEHVPFHECLSKNGKKIFINTEMLTN